MTFSHLICVVCVAGDVPSAHSFLPFVALVTMDTEMLLLWAVHRKIYQEKASFYKVVTFPVHTVNSEKAACLCKTHE